MEITTNPEPIFEKSQLRLRRHGELTIRIHIGLFAFIVIIFIFWAANIKR